jgi:C4-dicarboxylate-specific signal transduction histidine kinase
MVEIGVDVIAQTKAKQQSPESARIELARVARIAAVGELTASIAHEISQPIASVLANGSASQRWLAMQPPHLDEVRDAVAQIIRDADRACKMIASIRDFLNKNPLQHLLLDINETILQALALAVGKPRNRGIVVHTDFSPDLPSVLGDPIQLQQVMLNLITNSIDAMSSVSDRSKELFIRSARDPTGVLIQVRDTGIGLESHLAEKIFEPFFTTKSQGFGLGLSISRSIVEAHGGCLWVTAADLHGVVFHFTLPGAGDAK